MPTDGKYTVDAAAISRHATDVKTIATQIQTSMDTMQRKLEALQGVWTGAAAGQYTQLHTDWTTTQKKVKGTLEEIGLALGKASSAYSITETNVKTSFTGA
ncbi:WXG100 family type VII secretion target [Calidifontibacter terrae]